MEANQNTQQAGQDKTNQPIRSNPSEKAPVSAPHKDQDRDAKTREDGKPSEGQEQSRDKKATN